MDERIKIRAIEPSDNQALARIIRHIFEEFRVPRSGTAYLDPAIDDMHGAYGGDHAVYFVALRDDRLLGGAGIAPLKGVDPSICELQKMYLHRDARYQGLGRTLLELCLEKAREMGYTQCYLETMSNMEKAQGLYLKYGFQYLEERLGKTGHFACPVWMLKVL